jgi:hypothetical protein
MQRAPAWKQREYLIFDWMRTEGDLVLAAFALNLACFERNGNTRNPGRRERFWQDLAGF